MPFSTILGRNDQSAHVSAAYVGSGPLSRDRGLSSRFMAMLIEKVNEMFPPSSGG
jgi:hypothetical protein